MIEVDINYMAVVVGFIAAMVIGSVWYAKPVFGKKWMQLMNFSDADMKNGAGRAMTIMAVLALLMSYVLAHIVTYAQATTFFEGVQSGFWVWLGFVFTAILGNGVFEQRKPATMFIYLGNSLLTLLVVGGILAVWR